MDSAQLIDYLKRKTSPEKIRELILKRVATLKQENPENQEISLIDLGVQKPISATLLVNLLDDYLQGQITRFELYFIVHAMELSQDLTIANPQALDILYQLADPDMPHPLSIAYIKSVIYKP